MEVPWLVPWSRRSKEEIADESSENGPDRGHHDLSVEGVMIHGGRHCQSVVVLVPPIVLVSLWLYVFNAFGRLAALIPVIKVQVYYPPWHQIQYLR